MALLLCDVGLHIGVASCEDWGVLRQRDMTMEAEFLREFISQVLRQSLKATIVTNIMNEDPARTTPYIHGLVGPSSGRYFTCPVICAALVKFVMFWLWMTFRWTIYSSEELFCAIFFDLLDRNCCSIIYNCSENYKKNKRVLRSEFVLSNTSDVDK